jgi:dTDP-4-amino-4,6-dideoxygalactose transaminase
MARIFVDMDGTLAVWNAGKTIEEVYVPGYFSGLQPQDNVVQAMKSLAKAPGVEVFILSAVFADCPAYGDGLDRELFESGLCLPSGSSLTDTEVSRVIEALKEALG